MDDCDGVLVSCTICQRGSCVIDRTGFFDPEVIKWGDWVEILRKVMIVARVKGTYDPSGYSH